MNHEKIEKILRYVVMICLYAVIFAPIILDADFFFPAIFPKAIYIRLLAEIALIAYIPLAVLSQKYRPKFSIVYLSIAIFAVVVFITSITGVNFKYSFWGNYERMDGIFSWLHYWALIVIASSVLREKRDWMKLFSISLISAVLMSFYGFMQRIGAGSIGPLKIYETNMGRITSTIGNPAFFAVYLFFNITFGIIIGVNKRVSLWLRAWAGLALVPILIAYMMTGVRGAAVGLIFGVAAFGAGYLFWTKNIQHKKIFSIVFAGVILLFVVMFALRHTAIISRNQFFGRLFIMKLSDSTIQTRLISWKGALEGFKENPILGIGPQKFDIVFNKYFDPSFYTLVGNETWWDRAHNMILEVLGTMGIVGLISYLSVGASLLYVLWRLGKGHEESRTEVLILFAFLGAYFIQNLFVFDTISSYIMLVLIVAYIASPIFAKNDYSIYWLRIKEKMISIAPVSLNPVSLNKDIARYWWISLVLSALIIAPIAYLYNIKLMDHNKKFLYNVAYANVWPFSRIMDNYREIVELSDFDNREVVMKIGQYVGQAAYSGKLTLAEIQGAYRFAISEMDKSIAKNPKDVRLLLTYGNSLNVYAEIMKQYDKNEAEKVLRKSEAALKEAVSLGKSRQQVYYSLANVYMISGNYDKGISVLKDAIALDEKTSTGHWILSMAYATISEKEKAIKEAKAALDRNYFFSSEKEAGQIPALLVEANDFDALLKLYEKIAQDTNTATAKAKVAAILAQMGRKEEAIAASLEVLKKDPNLKDQVDKFIKQVESGEKADFLNQP